MSNESNDFRDVKQIGLWASLCTLGYVFWLVGAWKLSYRLLRCEGDGQYLCHRCSIWRLGSNHVTTISSCLSLRLTQTFVPMFFGGTADRFGCKETIALWRKKQKWHRPKLNKSLALQEFLKPIVLGYMFAFSGFWFMFNAMFDVLPKHIKDWIDTSTIVTDLFGPGGTDSSFWIGFLGMNKEGTMIMPDFLMSINFR